MSKTDEIIDLLVQAYFAEMETTMNYLANSVNLDGVRAEEIKKALSADIQEELSHAQLLASRIKVLGGAVPGSMEFQATQKSMQPPAKQTDVPAVIRGVIEAEEQAIELYNKIIQATDGVDYVTQDLAITILSDEEEHRRVFKGYLAEYE